MAQRDRIALLTAITGWLMFGGSFFLPVWLDQSHCYLGYRVFCLGLLSFIPDEAILPKVVLLGNFVMLVSPIAYRRLSTSKVRWTFPYLLVALVPFNVIVGLWPPLNSLSSASLGVGCYFWELSYPVVAIAFFLSRSRETSAKMILEL